MSSRCDLCGRFRANKDLAGMMGEGDEEWTECTSCMSDFDLERYRMSRPEPLPSKHRGGLMSDKNKVHYRGETFAWALCAGGNWRYFQAPLVTNDRRQVTCKKCKKANALRASDRSEK